MSSDKFYSTSHSIEKQIKEAYLDIEKRNQAASRGQPTAKVNTGMARHSKLINSIFKTKIDWGHHP